MTFDPPHACEDILVAIAEPDFPLTYVERFREYGIAYTDGGTSYRVIDYCPFDGTKLPESLRDEWFERLEGLGIDDPADARVPAEMRDGSWWRGSHPAQA